MFIENASDLCDVNRGADNNKRETHMKITSDGTKEALRRQLDFIGTSCRAFDEGHEHEALRIAVTLRILFYDSNSCTSLLTTLGKKESLKLLSIASPIKDKVSTDTDFAIAIPLIFGNSILPNLNSGNATFHLGIYDWLEMPVLYNGGQWLNRKDVLLAAANQDGGAHVDPKPGSNLRALKESWVSRSTHVNGVETTTSITDNHFPLLRAFGHEVLNSAELLNLIA